MDSDTRGVNMESWVDVVGYLAGITLMLCAVPQVILTIKLKSASGLSSLMLFLWGFGEVMLVIYAGVRSDIPMTLNATFCLLCISIIGYYKVRYG